MLRSVVLSLFVVKAFQGDGWAGWWEEADVAGGSVKQGEGGALFKNLE